MTLLVLEKSTKDIQIALISNLFEGYSDEVEIWVEKLSQLEDDEDKIQMATWFAKVAKSAKQNSEKYIETFPTTDKSEENRTIETLDDVYECNSTKTLFQFEEKYYILTKFNLTSKILNFRFDKHSETGYESPLDQPHSFSFCELCNREIKNITKTKNFAVSPIRLR